ncbi:MAG: hypothetical protein WKF84_08755 [Pyrinomonadaceae bacterium]
MLNRANAIDDLMRRNRLTARAQNDWVALKTDLNQLANAYNVSWQWNQRNQPIGSNTGAANRPYRLSDAQVGAIIARIETRANAYRTSADAALDQSRA